MSNGTRGVKPSSICDADIFLLRYSKRLLKRYANRKRYLEGSQRIWCGMIFLQYSKLHHATCHHRIFILLVRRWLLYVGVQEQLGRASISKEEGKNNHKLPPPLPGHETIPIANHLEPPLGNQEDTHRKNSGWWSQAAASGGKSMVDSFRLSRSPMSGNWTQPSYLSASLLAVKFPSMIPLPCLISGTIEKMKNTKKQRPSGWLVIRSLFDLDGICATLWHWRDKAWKAVALGSLTIKLIANLLFQLLWAHNLRARGQF